MYHPVIPLKLVIGISTALLVHTNFLLSPAKAQQCYPSASTAGYGRGFTSPDSNVAEELGFHTWFAGDINGDGFIDIAATKRRLVETSSFAGQPHLALYSGEDLSPMVQYFFQDVTIAENVGERGGAVGDINNDGKDEFFFVSQKTSYPVKNGRINVISRTEGQLYAIVGNHYSFGDGAATIDDLNGDGIPEIVGGPYKLYPSGSYSSKNAFAIYSGADGTPLAFHQEPSSVHIALFGSRIYPVGDFNGDGIRDLIVGGPFDIAIYSGADLLSENIQPITTILETNDERLIFLSPIADLGDLDGDSDDEVAFATTYQNIPYLNFLRWNQSLQLVEWLRFPQSMHGVSSIREIHSAGDITGDGINELALLLIDEQLNGNNVDVRIIDPYWQQAIIDLTPADLQFSPSYGAVSLAAGTDVNGDGFFDLIVGDANDTTGFDFSTYNQNAPQEPPPFTYFLNSVESGRITITSLSGDQNQNQQPDVCESPNPFVPPPPSGGNSGGNSGSGSNGGSTGDTSGNSNNGGGSDDENEEPTIVTMIGTIESLVSGYENGESLMSSEQRLTLRATLKLLRRELKTEYSGAEQKKKLKQFKRLKRNFRSGTKSTHSVSKRSRAWARFSRILSRLL